MAKRLHKTLLDYLVIAISPAMIIALVDSLVLFLIQVFYRGSYDWRLEYVFTLFVIGAVLIGRISIDEGRERAVLFAIPLGIAILLAIHRFVVIHGPLAPFSLLINCGLIALIWWSADKLTWDCTLIDEREEDSGEGLLETVGLDRPDHAAIQREITPVPEAETEATTSREDVPTSWWDRFVERRRRPHAPGVWVVYFSLAALPLFGLGQLFIPTDYLPARQYAFELLFIYTASGLGLLLSTSFLGLRRYLRQRRQEMPLMMVNLWLGIGVALIAGVMFAAMLLPRPNAEYAISEPPFRIGSPDQNSSRYGTGREGVEEKQPEAHPEPRDDAKVDSPQSDQPGKSKSANSPKGGEKKSADNRQEPSKDEPNTGKTDDDNAGQKKGGDSTKSAKQPGETGESKSARDQAKSREKQLPDRESEKKTKPSSGSGAAETKPPEKSPTPREGGQKPANPLSPPAPAMPGVPSVFAVAVLFKWILYAALAALAAYAIWTHLAELLTALRDFRQSLANFWHWLFGGKSRQEDEVAEEESHKGPLLRRFADFTDPFATGTAGRYPPEELVRYTFEALEAWARENGHTRLPEQTPHEFARCLATDVSSLADDARLLADLYCQVAYAPGTLQVATVTRLPRLWQEMRAAVGRPVSPAAD